MSLAIVTNVPGAPFLRVQPMSSHSPFTSSGHAMPSGGGELYVNSSDAVHDDGMMARELARG